jgi:hypothetical protein
METSLIFSATCRKLVSDLDELIAVVFCKLLLLLLLFFSASVRSVLFCVLSYMSFYLFFPTAFAGLSCAVNLLHPRQSLPSSVTWFINEAGTAYVVSVQAWLHIVHSEHARFPFVPAPPRGGYALAQSTRCLP